MLNKQQNPLISFHQSHKLDNKYARMQTDQQDFTLEANLSQGCPQQRGVLSPLQWSIVGDNLITSLNAHFIFYCFGNTLFCPIVVRIKPFSTGFVTTTFLLQSWNPYIVGMEFLALWAKLCADRCIPHIFHMIHCCSRKIPFNVQR